MCPSMKSKVVFITDYSKSLNNTKPIGIGTLSPSRKQLAGTTAFIPSYGSCSKIKLPQGHRSSSNAP